MSQKRIKEIETRLYYLHGLTKGRKADSALAKGLLVERKQKIAQLEKELQQLKRGANMVKKKKTTTRKRGRVSVKAHTRRYPR